MSGDDNSVTGDYVVCSLVRAVTIATAAFASWHGGSTHHRPVGPWGGTPTISRSHTGDGGTSFTSTSITGGPAHEVEEAEP